MLCIGNFNNLTCIFLARVTKHLSICWCSIPSLRRNGGSLLWVDSPSVWHPQLLFTFHIPHMSYRHNLYHVTHVAYQTCSADGTFPKCPMEFHPKPISKIGETSPWILAPAGHENGLPAMCTLGTILCKPIVISSCQQFLKSEIYKFKLTTLSAYKLFSQPWDSSHEVWLFHMVYFGLCHGLILIAMIQTIYLKPELQSAKHLVSLDAYNLFIAATITEAFSEFIKFKYFQMLSTSILPKLVYFTPSWSYFNLQGTIPSFM